MQNKEEDISKIQSVFVVLVLSIVLIVSHLVIKTEYGGYKNKSEIEIISYSGGL